MEPMPAARGTGHKCLRCWGSLGLPQGPAQPAESRHDLKQLGSESSSESGEG